MRRQQTIVRKPATKFPHLNKKLQQSKIRANVKKTRHQGK
jgi:hypothetical protein